MELVQWGASVWDTLFSTRRQPGNEKRCPGDTMSAGYVEDYYGRHRPLCLSSLHIEDMEDVIIIAMQSVALVGIAGLGYVGWKLWKARKQQLAADEASSPVSILVDIHQEALKDLRSQTAAVLDAQQGVLKEQKAVLTDQQEALKDFRSHAATATAAQQDALKDQQAALRDYQNVLMDHQALLHDIRSHDRYHEELLRRQERNAHIFEGSSALINYVQNAMFPQGRANHHHRPRDMVWHGDGQPVPVAVAPVPHGRLQLPAPGGADGADGQP